MYKNQVLEALKAKFEGVTISFLERIATKINKTITSEDEISDAVAKVSLSQLLEMYGDSRATEATQTAIKTYEAKYGLKEGKVIKQEEKAQSQEPNTQEEIPTWAKSLIEGQAQLATRLSSFESTQITKSRRSQLSEVISKLPQSVKRAYERTPVENMSDEEFSGLISEVKEEVDSYVRDFNSRGARFNTPTAQNGSSNPSEKLTEEQLRNISRREGVTNEGQPF